MSTEATIALITAGIALIGTIGSFLWSAKKTDLDILRQIIDELKEEITGLKRANRDLKRWASKLVAQVKELGGTPVDYEEEED